MTQIRILSGDDVRKTLSMEMAIEAMRMAFLAMYDERAQVPHRVLLDMPDHHGVALFMPSRLDDVMGVKTVTLFDGNPALNLPYIQGCYCLLDATTGTPLAFADASVLTAIRTGAASGLATQLLARQDSRRAAIFGAGVQGRSQLEAVCTVRPIREAKVFDPFPAAAERFVADMEPRLNISIAVADSPEDALAGADVVCAASVSETPIFPDEALEDGTHLNAVGSYQPHVQEIPAETVVRARVVVDDRDAALSETGDLIIPIRKGIFNPRHIHGDLGELCAKRVAGRTDDKQVTFFKSVGIAIQDLAACKTALSQAEELGVGQIVEI